MSPHFRCYTLATTDCTQTHTEHAHGYHTHVEQTSATSFSEGKWQAAASNSPWTLNYTEIKQCKYRLSWSLSVVRYCTAGVVKKQARATAKMQIIEINVMFQAVHGMWNAGMGWCLYSERHGHGSLLASGSLLHYSTYDFSYHIDRVRRDEDDGEWFTDPEHHWKASDLVKCVVSTVIP